MFRTSDTPTYMYGANQHSKKPLG